MKLDYNIFLYERYELVKNNTYINLKIFKLNKNDFINLNKLLLNKLVLITQNGIRAYIIQN